MIFFFQNIQWYSLVFLKFVLKKLEVLNIKINFKEYLNTQTKLKIFQIYKQTFVLEVSVKIFLNIIFKNIYEKSLYN